MYVHCVLVIIKLSLAAFCYNISIKPWITLESQSLWEVADAKELVTSGGILTKVFVRLCTSKLSMVGIDVRVEYEVAWLF